MTTTVATPLDAATVVTAMRSAGATHVVTVPDTNQRTVLEELADGGDLPVVRAASEDDVLGICAGLWIGGHRPLALVQQLGLFASVNALRAITHDLAIPLSILAGMYGRETDREIRESPKSSVRLCTPVLDALALSWVLIETPRDGPLLAELLAAPFELLTTSVVLLGAPTT